MVVKDQVEYYQRTTNRSRVDVLRRMTESFSKRKNEVNMTDYLSRLREEQNKRKKEKVKEKQRELEKEVDKELER